MGEIATPSSQGRCSYITLSQLYNCTPLPAHNVAVGFFWFLRQLEQTSREKLEEACVKVAHLKICQYLFPVKADMCLPAREQETRERLAPIAETLFFLNGNHCPSTEEISHGALVVPTVSAKVCQS